MRSAFGFSGQKCSANSRVYVERPVLRRVRRATRREDRGDHDRRSDRPPVLARSGHQCQGASTAMSRPSRTRDRDGPPGDRRRAGHRAWARHGLLRRPDGRVRPADRPPPVPGRAVRPVHRRRRGRLDRRGASAVERHEPRADRRASTPRTRPRSTPSSTRSRPASSTSTDAPARRPARGRASSRSVAGRAAPRRARPAAASTTSSSSCASRARRSSTDGTGYQTSPGRQSQLIGESRSRGGDMTVSRTRMKPSSSGVRRDPSGVRTNAGPRHVRQPSRS